jgi:CxxC motif-containing protein (DUF1111 family)
MVKIEYFNSGVVLASLAMLLIPVKGGAYKVISDVFTRPHNVTHRSNAQSCSDCHIIPESGGSSRVTVTRAGHYEGGRFIDGPDGGLLHTRGGTARLPPQSITGLRVSTNLLGIGYVEAIPDEEISQIADLQAAQTKGEIHGQVARATALELLGRGQHAGRFGWKSQHSSLYSFAADSLANELGVPNALYPLDSGSKPERLSPTDSQSTPIPDQSQTLRELTAFLRSTEPIERDPALAGSPDAAKGEQIFDRIGCALCHLPSLKTAATGSILPDGSRVPKRLGNKIIHPYSDFLLHDVGTGDGIVQHAAAQDADQSTANKFRTAPLWGLRYRSWLMHDGKSVTYHQAIERHRGEASCAVDSYEKLIPAEKHALREFLNSL